MSLKTAIQKKFENLFVSVVLYESECILRCKVFQNGSIKKSFTKTFALSSSSDTLDQAVENYLLALHDHYAFVYVTFLLGSMGQGAFEGVGEKAFLKHSVDLKNVHSVSINKEWTVYASFIEIKWSNALFSEIGLDLIYSPFILLNDFILSQKPKQKPTGYLLNAQDFFVIVVMDGSKLTFGAFFKTQSDTTFNSKTDAESDWENESQEEGVTNLGEMPELLVDEGDDEMESLSALEDMDDFDSIDSIDSFSDVDHAKTLGHFKGMDNVKEEDASLSLYGRDLLVFKYLKSSLEEYYHNPLYTSAFIEEIVIFDGYEMSSDLIHQIEDDLMMDIEIHKVDIADRMCDIAIKEVFA